MPLFLLDTPVTKVLSLVDNSLTLTCGSDDSSYLSLTTPEIEYWAMTFCANSDSRMPSNKTEKPFLSILIKTIYTIERSIMYNAYMTSTPGQGLNDPYKFCIFLEPLYFSPINSYKIHINKIPFKLLPAFACGRGTNSTPPLFGYRRDKVGVRKEGLEF